VADAPETPGDGEGAVVPDAPVTPGDGEADAPETPADGEGAGAADAPDPPSEEVDVPYDPYVPDAREDPGASEELYVPTAPDEPEAADDPEVAVDPDGAGGPEGAGELDGVPPAAPPEPVVGLGTDEEGGVSELTSESGPP